MENLEDALDGLGLCLIYVQEPDPVLYVYGILLNETGDDRGVICFHSTYKVSNTIEHATSTFIQSQSGIHVLDTRLPHRVYMFTAIWD